MKTILVTSQKGGVGKGLVSTETAMSLARSGIAYSFYELDPQGGPPTIEREDAEIAVVDTPGYITPHLPDQMSASDIIVIPTRASMSDREPFIRTLTMAKTHAPHASIVVVVNEWNSYTANRLYTDWLETLASEKDFQLTCIPHTEAVPRAGMEQISALMYMRRHGPQRAFNMLYDTINTIRRAAGLEDEHFLINGGHQNGEEKD